MIRRANFSWGGTLLEVLIGLVILALVMTSVVDAMGQNRRAQAEIQWHEKTTKFAMQWRQARLAQKKWSLGEQGTFDALDSATRYVWRLQQIPSSGANIELDSAWRQLVIQDSSSSVFSEFLMRIGDLQPAGKDAQP